jgi:hypothetical protein
MPLLLFLECPSGEIASTGNDAHSRRRTLYALSPGPVHCNSGDTSIVQRPVTVKSALAITSTIQHNATSRAGDELF